MLMLTGWPVIVTKRSSGLAGCPGPGAVPGSVTRIWHCDWARISLIFEPALPMTAGQRCAILLTLTSTDKRVRDEDLLSLTARGRCTAGTGRDTSERRLRSRHALGLLAVGADARVRTGVALLVLEKDGSNVVDSDVDGVGDTRDRKDALG